MTAKRPRKAPAKAGAKDEPRRPVFTTLPLPTGASLDLTKAEQARLEGSVATVEGLEDFAENLGPDGFEEFKRGMGVAIGFSSLERMIQEIETGKFGLSEWTALEIAYYLREALAGYKLAMQISNGALSEQNRLAVAGVMSARRAAYARWGADSAGKAMRKVEREWLDWQDTEPSRFASDAAFARAMVQKHPAITSEASIKNACSRWRKRRK